MFLGTYFYIENRCYSYWWDTGSAKLFHCSDSSHICCILFRKPETFFNNGIGAALANQSYLVGLSKFFGKKTTILELSGILTCSITVMVFIALKAETTWKINISLDYILTQQ